MMSRKPAVRTRKEREAELKLFAASDEGKWVLADMAKRCLGIPAGEGITRTRLYIELILAHEYMHGEERP